MRDPGLVLSTMASSCTSTTVLFYSCCRAWSLGLLRVNACSTQSAIQLEYLTGDTASHLFKSFSFFCFFLWQSYDLSDVWPLYGISSKHSHLNDFSMAFNLRVWSLYSQLQLFWVILEYFQRQGSVLWSGVKSGIICVEKNPILTAVSKFILFLSLSSVSNLRNEKIEEKRARRCIYWLVTNSKSFNLRAMGTTFSVLNDETAISPHTCRIFSLKPFPSN